MDTILLTLLLTAAIGPLALVGIYTIATYFDLDIASRLLDATAWALTLQWQIGGWINLAGGLALAGLGLWVSVHEGSPAQRIGSFVVLVMGGLWRAWRGGSIIWGPHREL